MSEESQRGARVAARAAGRPWSRPLLPFLIALAFVAIATGSLAGQPAAGQSHVRARIAGSEPFTWDPARAGDAGSASVIAQVFEGLTAFDANSLVQPALAESWQVSDDGQLLTFRMRPGVTYSDGSPIAAQDVVDSWLRLVDPVRPSPLSSLLADVAGALDYQAGLIGPEQVGLRAEGESVVVELRRPATYFLSLTASPSLAVVPPQMVGRLDGPPPADIVVSGAYLPSVDTDVIRLDGNERYWAGNPPLDSIELVTDFGGQSGVSVFEAGDIDYVGVSASDASWVKYDDALGPQLRRTDSFAVTYYGFETTRAPFDDARVRLAFASAVDWDRMVRLAGGVPATSLVPPGVPARDDVDHRPAHDPESARALMAEAGYPSGEDFPVVRLATYGVGFEETVAAQIEDVLGVTIDVETRDSQPHFDYLAGTQRPDFWTLSWIADYPHPHDFLGLLLESGSASNTGRWSNAEYDALIEQAAASTDLDEQMALYSQAQQILAREAPIIPVDYDQSWALGRTGLLGALESGVGLVRLAGLDWAPGTGR